MIIHDEGETRAEVCEECEHLLRAMPLTCALVKRQKQIGPLPCPHALRAMLYDAEAVCPHPDETWATRWRMADVLPLPAEAAGAALDRAVSGAATSSSESSDAQASGAGASANVNASVSAEPAGTIVQGDGAIAQGDVINTSASANGSSCAAKTLAREVNIDAIERRASEQLSRRRGVSHRAFYVQGNPTRPLAAP